jgi:glycoside/pentoside/hexuronide:cation symporter, GPH family
MKAQVDLPEAKVAATGQSSPADERLSLKTKVGYGVGNVAVMIGKQAPKQLSLPIYNLALGVSPGAVGTVLALGRIVDAFTDPFVGHLSDRLATRWGRRRPMIFLGAIFAALFFTALWLCPRGLTPAGCLIYFIGASLLYYMSLSVFCVPWYALGYELAPNYDERTRLMAFQGFMGPLGQILVFWLYPWTQLGIKHGWFTDTIHGIRWIGFGAGLVMVLFGFLPVLLVRERFGSDAAGARKAKKPRPSLWAGIKAAVKNGPFVRLAIAVSTVLIGTSMVGGLGLYVFIFCLFGGDKAAGSVLLGWHGTTGLISNMVFTPLLSKLSVRYGKKEVFLAALGWGFARLCLLWFLLDPAHPYLVMVNAVLIGVDNAAIFMLCHAMIADVCDVDERDCGSRREGLYGSLFSWLYKNGIALAYALSGFILVWVGFKAKLGGNQTHSTLLLMKSSYCLVPALFFLASFLVFWRYPIGRRFATQVRAELDERRRAAAAAKEDA